MSLLQYYCWLGFPKLFTCPGVICVPLLNRCMFAITFGTLSTKVARHALRHGVAGIPFPIVSTRGHRGTSWFTHVTMVPQEETRHCVPLSHLGPDCFTFPSDKDDNVYYRCALLHFKHPANDVMDCEVQWTESVFIHASVMLMAFPIVSSRGSNVSFPLRQSWLHA